MDLPRVSGTNKAVKRVPITQIAPVNKCQSYEGISNLYRNVKVMRYCQSYKEMSKLQRNVKVIKECQSYKDMSKL